MIQLIPNKKYKISLPWQDSFIATLTKLPNKVDAYYKWIYEDGKRFSNREEDVNRWLNKKLIEEVK